MTRCTYLIFCTPAYLLGLGSTDCDVILGLGSPDGHVILGLGSPDCDVVLGLRSPDGHVYRYQPLYRARWTRQFVSGM